MRRRNLFASLTVVAICAVGPSSHPAAQNAQPPAQPFRSRVDLLTLDVAAVDGKGRPVEDLRAGDFVVKVDGKVRPVVSAQLVKVERVDRAPSAQPPAEPVNPLVSTNAGAERGRRVAVAVDQTLITPGSIPLVMRSAARFVDGLAPADYAALLAFPEPGPRVDFTTDKTLVRDALPRIVGQPAKNFMTQFNLTLQEALAIDVERTLVNLNSATGGVDEASIGLTMRRVLERAECPSGRDQCVRDLGNEAMREALEIRSDANVSMRRLESFLKELAAMDGPKTMVLVSAGLVAENQALLEDIAKSAADARTTIQVVSVNRERERDLTDAANGQSRMTLQDRSLELSGLEILADRTGGALYRAIGPAQGVFDQVALELSASYLVAVERREGDPDRQRIDVEVKRRGVKVRSPKSVTSTAALNAKRPKPDVLRDLLGLPAPIPGIPVGFSTFTRRDPAGAYRLNLAAQIGQQGGAAGEVGVGYAVFDQQNKLVVSKADRVQPASSGRANEPLAYDTSLELRPGTYSIRVAVVDPEGRRGMAIGRLELPPVTGDAPATSDLIVGAVPDVGETVHPRVEPHVAGRIAAYLEVYSPGVTVTLDIAEGESSPALATAALNIGPGDQPTWRVATGAVDAALLPGRYVARATVKRDGAPLRVVSRPFVLDRSATVAAAAAPLPARVRLSREVQARTASYVGSFVGGLSNVVGQEDFQLSGPDRRVTSEFLLVRHPASPGDLLTYRDVMQVNGKAIPDRQERLAELFLQPVGLIRDRVRQITMAAEQHVPSILNPIFVLAFLQADFQSRFELTVNDASAEWPRAVKAVAFVETGRPTILRAGPLGDLDVPVHGTAWIEEATGRVLQTELQVPIGRTTTTVVTKFTLDRRLQIMVPEEMRTERPTGVATYGNFRRFSVQTGTNIDTPR